MGRKGDGATRRIMTRPDFFTDFVLILSYLLIAAHRSFSFLQMFVVAPFFVVALHTPGGTLFSASSYLYIDYL